MNAESDDQPQASEQQQWEELLTAHLRGGLTDTDRPRFQELLAASEARRSELADLERVTNRLAAWAQPGDPADDSDAPPTKLDARISRLFEGVTAGRIGPTAAVVPLAARSRRWLPIGTALAGVAAGAAAVLIVSNPQSDAPRPSGPTVLAVSDLKSEPGVRATAGVIDHTWGVEVQFTVSGLPAGADYEVIVTADDGRVYGAGAFVGVNRELDCRMNSAVLLADARDFAVLDPVGRRVVWGDLPDPSA